MKKCFGYTLIEILIVMVIISIVASTALLTVHFNRKKQCEDFANQLVNLISLAENEALMRQKVIGVGLSHTAIQFYEWDEKNNQWIIAAEKVFREKKLLDSMQVQLSIQDEKIPADNKPHLIISGNGDIPDFIFSLGEKNQLPLYRVIGEESGAVYVK